MDYLFYSPSFSIFLQMMKNSGIILSAARWNFNITRTCSQHWLYYCFLFETNRRWLLKLFEDFQLCSVFLDIERCQRLHLNLHIVWEENSCVPFSTWATKAVGIHSFAVRRFALARRENAKRFVQAVTCFMWHSFVFMNVLHVCQPTCSR